MYSVGENSRDNDSPEFLADSEVLDQTSSRKFLARAAAGITVVEVLQMVSTLQMVCTHVN